MSTVVLAYGEWPFTTGALLSRGFRALGHDVHILPLQRYLRGRPNKIFRYLERDIPYLSWVDAKRWLRRSGVSPDLFLWVESPRFVEVKIARDFPCPTAAWIIDTAIRTARLKFLSRQYDHVFVSQFEAVSNFQASGLPVSWLPLAADPEIHAPVDRQIEFDIGFVGNLTSPAYKQRIELLRALRDNFRLLVTRAYGREMAEAYSRCKLGFNIGQLRGLNMRIFEVMAIGRCLVTDTFANGLGELFTDGVHFEGYDSERTLLLRVAGLLADPKRAESIALAARREVLAKHTYEHRAAKILADMLDGDIRPGSHPMPT
jgi:glycosyltransferase involved in cell wall biosynthesis